VKKRKNKMGKAINAFIEKVSESSVRVTKLSILDFNETYGVREILVIKTKNNRPHEKVVTKVRKATYLYNKKTTEGWEVVEEVLVPRDENNQSIVPTIVGSVTRDNRFEEKEMKRYVEDD
jgi:hypothetical protein